MEIMNPTKRSNSNYTSWAFGSRPIENLIPATTNYNTGHGGLFFAAPPPPPPSFYFSYPPYNYKSSTHSVFNPQMAAVAPPLLPLPTNIKPNNTFPSRTKSLNSSPSPIRKQKPLTPKKSPKKPQTRKEYSDPIAKPNKQFLVAATVPLAGPDLHDLPKGGDKVLKKTTPFAGNSNVRESGFERFSGSVAFPLISPPPSSLPLPRFSVRPKQISSCTAEAAAGGGKNIVDAGAASDNLRRLLRLR